MILEVFFMLRSAFLYHIGNLCQLLDLLSCIFDELFSSLNARADICDSGKFLVAEGLHSFLQLHEALHDTFAAIGSSIVHALQEFDGLICSCNPVICLCQLGVLLYACPLNLFNLDEVAL